MSVKRALAQFVLSLLLGVFFFYRVIQDERFASSEPPLWGVAGIGIYLLLLMHRALVLVFALFGKENTVAGGLVFARFLITTMWAVFVLAALALVFAMTRESLAVGWIGIALPLAVLLPVATITIVLGGHKPILDWFNSLRRKT